MSEIKEVLADNPASRLLNILHKAKEATYSEPEYSGAVWARVLDVEASPSELLTAYAKLFSLNQEAYEAVIKFYPRQKNTHIKWKNGIEKCLKAHSPFHHPWKSILGGLCVPDIIDTLQVADDNLAHFITPTYVNELSIQKLKDEFQTLKQKISEDDSFSNQLKNFLIDELQKILEALDHYDLNGSTPIRNAIYNIVSNSDIKKNTSFSFKKELCSFLIVAATSISIINDIADFPDSLESIKDHLFQVDEAPSTPPTSQPSTLPKALTAFRKEKDGILER